MRIDLEVRGLAETIDSLQELADVFNEIADARERAVDGKPAPSLVSQVEDLGRGKGDFLGRDTLSPAMPALAAGAPFPGPSVTRQPFSPDQELTVRAPDLVAAVRDLGRPLKAALGATHVANSALRGDPTAGLHMAAGILDRGWRSAGEQASGEPWGILLGLATATFTTALAATVGGLAAFTASLKLATDAGDAFGNARTITGGSSADLAALIQFGISPGVGGVAAEQFRIAAQNDPGVRAGRAQLGLGPVSSSPFADLNSANLYSQTLEALAAVQDPTRQLRIARQLHMEGALGDLRVSDDVRQQRSRVAGDATAAFNPKFLQNTRDLTAQVNLMGDAFSTLLAELTGPAMGDVRVLSGMVLDWMHDGIPLARELGALMHDNFASMVEGAARVGATLHHWLDGPTRERDIKERGIFGPFQAAEEDANQIVAEFKRRQAMQGGGSFDYRGGGAFPWGMVNGADFGGQVLKGGGAVPHSRATSSGGTSSAANAAPTTIQVAQLQATRDLIVALNGVRGEFGGGERTRSAVPAAFLASTPGDPYRKFLEMQALGLGFFGTGNA